MTLNMDWMYKRPTIDTEAFLLGKPIDKSLEALQNPDGCPTSNEDIGEKPGALFLEAAASAALEAEAKLREDPLYAIKKREEEQRRQLLNNPVRLKKMQEEMEKQRLAAEKKSGKVSEKSLMAKMLTLKSKYGADLKDILSNALSSEDEDDDKRKSHHKSSKRKRERSRSRSPERRKDSRDRPSHRSSRNSRVESSSHRRNDRSRSRSPRHSKQRISPRREDSSSNRRRDASPIRNRDIPKPTATKVIPHKSTALSSKRMDPAELERKRLEMMSAAKQRDVDREENVRSYEKKDAEADAKNSAVASGRSGGFIMPMMRAAVDTDTLESRIRTKGKGIQRTRAALEKNFTDR